MVARMGQSRTLKAHPARIGLEDVLPLQRGGSAEIAAALRAQFSVATSSPAANLQ